MTGGAVVPAKDELYHVYCKDYFEKDLSNWFAVALQRTGRRSRARIK